MLRITFLFFLLLGVINCSQSGSGFLDATTPVESVTPVPVYQDRQYLFTLGGTVNHYAIGIYDTDGNFLHQISRYRQPSTAAIPRGLVQLDNNTMVFALDTLDRLEIFDFRDFSFNSFFSGGTLTGNVYGMSNDLNNNPLVLESNNIERFDSAGEQTVPVYINTTVGGCTINGARLMVRHENQLYVTSYANNRILIYDLNPTVPTCVASIATAVNPHGILIHSNGSLYFNTAGDDRIYRANLDGSGITAIFNTNLGILNNPATMLELPDGSIIVSSTGTNSIERFDENGTYLGVFIRDVLSLSVTDMGFMVRSELVE
jgi:hypothetical protein